MTMNHKDLIDDLFQIQNLPITFKLLSRKIPVSVNAAKQLLYQYAKESNLPESQIVYYVESPSQDSVSVKLVKGSQLDQESDVKVVHIHSILPAETVDINAIYLIDSDLAAKDTLKQTTISRIVICDQIKAKDRQKESIDTISPALIKAGSAPILGSQKVNVPKSNSSGTDKLSFFEKKAASERASSNKKGGKKSLGKISQFTKSAAVDKPKEKAEEPVYAGKPITVKQINSTEDISTSTLEKSQSTASMVVESQELDIEPPKVIHLTKQSALEAEKVKELFDEPDPLPKRKDPVQEEDATESQQTRRVRKKRKVVKAESVLVGKYMQTKDVETWESYSEDEVVPTTKPNPIKSSVPAPSSSSKKDKAQPGPKQRTIQSFFTKKQ